ncbi:DUF2909 domain-containing protein [Pseudidiomarina sp. 1APP75-32.1]|uniref:DUF2909 domain-containing protein n=1 Tax=Pseudidiomarina terrestris TaxID=2820060 RepID=A0AAW7R3L4_9GAMM|nr:MULTISPECIES: DUF2909 domain-containing protein [unclassified Pseudidiomarina]MDN7125567.1 DUF2909 domain-containing protein [Pseudidiomarina sp. 1APP75-32.1]MDN7126186.1 DUF2909 domain-containing protein [Pseudidiomarina sp. 1APR75-33.1]MDN7130570.1 DUF2909 domain-containing protein [Pseudidiomarina sp. 1APR75-15]MDN7137101.1 DUF2909 domain-containing protein [Pseudidiomarina sp. 1ASP75-14]MEA3588361.1 DUF2909 domain-containing protein [Pseudidiomarina sp. 1APP75-27a]
MVFIAKLILVLLMLFMVYNLMRALITMLRNDPTKPPMTRYLGRRVGASVLAIIIIVLLLASGVLEPNPRPY